MAARTIPDSVGQPYHSTGGVSATARCHDSLRRLPVDGHTTDVTPKDAQLLLQLGALLNAGRRWDDAITAYKKYLKTQSPKDVVSIHLDLGRLSFLAGHFQESVAYFGKAKSLLSDSNSESNRLRQQRLLKRSRPIIAEALLAAGHYSELSKRIAAGKKDRAPTDAWSAPVVWNIRIMIGEKIGEHLRRHAS